MRPIGDTKSFTVETDVEPVKFYSRPELRSSTKPVVLFIGGTFRGPEHFIHWFHRLEPDVDVVVTTLPGQENPSPEAEVTVARFTRAMVQAVGVLTPQRNLLVVGESVGGLVALGLRDLAKSVVLVDPPLRTGKLWQVEAWARKACARPDQPPPIPFLKGVFGIEGGKVVAPLDYSPLFDDLPIPATVITGDEPLLPVRLTLFPPCVLDDEDLQLLSRKPNVAIRRIRGPHILLTSSPFSCAAIIYEQLSALVGEPVDGIA